MLYIQIVYFFLYLKYDLMDLKEESLGGATNATPRKCKLSAYANWNLTSKIMQNMYAKLLCLFEHSRRTIRPGTVLEC